MINFCPLVGKARESLFLIIANLIMRTDDLSEDGLWWVLHNMVILGKMGNPMLAKAAAEDLEIDNMNVETAFLNGELTDTEILMEVPRYFEEIFPEIKTSSKSLVNSCAKILQKD